MFVPFMVPKALMPVPGKGEMQPWRAEPAGALPLLGHVIEVALDEVYAECVVFTPVMMVWLSRLNASPTN